MARSRSKPSVEQKINVLITVKLNCLDAGLTINWCKFWYLDREERTKG